jgi:hypothetical protein
MTLKGMVKNYGGLYEDIFSGCGYRGGHRKIFEDPACWSRAEPGNSGVGSRISTT